MATLAPGQNTVLGAASSGTEGGEHAPATAERSAAAALTGFILVVLRRPKQKRQQLHQNYRCHHARTRFAPRSSALYPMQLIVCRDRV